MGRGKELDAQMRSRICELRSIGMPYSKIQERHPEISISTMRTTVAREKLRSNNNTKPRPGRPRKLTEDQRDHLYEIVTKNPQMTDAELLAEVDHAIGLRTLRDLLADMKKRKPVPASRKKAEKKAAT